MKQDTSKMVQLANAMVVVNKKHKSLRWIKLCHDVLLTSFAVLVAITGLVYTYEQFRPIADDIKVPAIVTTLNEIEATDPIELWPMVYVNPDLKDVTLNTALWCDYGSGKGYEFTSSSTQSLAPTVTIDQVEMIAHNLSANETANTKTTARWLRSYAQAQTIPKFTYSGSIPTAIATCYGEHTLSAKTPILGITKNLTIPSYTFDYVWYLQPEFDENDD